MILVLDLAAAAGVDKACTIVTQLISLSQEVRGLGSHGVRESVSQESESLPSFPIITISWSHNHQWPQGVREPEK